MSPSKAGELELPQGVTKEQFDAAAKLIREKAAHLKGEVVVHGSRAAGKAPTSDIDFAIRVSEEEFNSLIKERFKTATTAATRSSTTSRRIPARPKSVRCSTQSRPGRFSPARPAFATSGSNSRVRWACRSTSRSSASVDRSTRNHRFLFHGRRGPLLQGVPGLRV